MSTRRKVDPSIEATWIDGLKRLAVRQPFTSDRQSFAYRPYEVLGICAGAARFQTVPNDVLSFLGEVTSRLSAEQRERTWSRLLATYAGKVLGFPYSTCISPNIHDWDWPELALYAWLRQLDVDGNQLDEARRRELEAEIMERALTTATDSLDIGQLAILSTSLCSVVTETLGSRLTEVWKNQEPGGSALNVIEKMCRRFPLAARQLLKRHNNRQTFQINDEYDVQDLLHSLLVLHFDDVRPEEWTPSYAGKSSRVDFLLKREKILVEVKMTRRNLNQVKVVEELAIDRQQYIAHPDCECLVCFVFDPENRCTNPTALEADASGLRDGFRTLVVVAPQGT